MSFDCVVIGGGAAGMMAAIQCKENNMQTVIIEHTAKLGTKILKTGNGKCNFSNTFIPWRRSQKSKRKNWSIPIHWWITSASTIPCACI